MRSKDSIITLGFILVNVLLKSINLCEAPFWYDEMISVKNTLLDFGHIKHEAEWDNNPPFYYYCLWVWLHLFQVNEFNARILSVLFVSVAIGLTYSFSRKYFGLRTAIWTCILLSLSNFLFYYAQEARAYSLVLLLGLISSVVFFKSIENEKVWLILLLSLVNFLLVYTHYISGLILVFQSVYLFYHHRPLFNKIFGLQFIIVAALVFLRFTWKQVTHIIGFGEDKDFWLQKASLNDFWVALDELMFNRWIVIVFLLLFGYWIVCRKGALIVRENTYLEYCLLIGFGSIIVLFLVGTLKPVFLSRYLIFVVPFATLSLVNLLTRFKVWGNVVLGVLTLYFLSRIHFSKECSMDYKSVASQVKKLKDSNDIVIINTKDNLNLFCYYYDRDKYLGNKKSDSVFNQEGIVGLSEIEELNAINYGNTKRVFLVQTYHTLNGRQDVIGDFLDSTEGKVFNSSHIKGVEFSVYILNKRN